MRGRKPKPTARQISEGDPRDRGINKLREKLEREPSATRGLPRCPSHLKGVARRAWEFITEELKDMKIDHRPDAHKLEGYCQNYARAVKAEMQLEREGITVKESIIDPDSGEVVVLKIKKHPAVEIANAAWKLVNAFGSEFGLSPVARTRLAIEKKDEAAMQLADILSRERPQRTTVN